VEVEVTSLLPLFLPPPIERPLEKAERLFFLFLSGKGCSSPFPPFGLELGEERKPIRADVGSSPPLPLRYPEDRPRLSPLLNPSASREAQSFLLAQKRRER